MVNIKQLHTKPVPCSRRDLSILINYLMRLFVDRPATLCSCIPCIGIAMVSTMIIVMPVLYITSICLFQQYQ